MNNYMAMEWYQKEEKDRKDKQKLSEIFKVNKELKELLRILQNRINIKEYDVQAKKWGRYVVQASIWDVTYRNNMENPMVALAQAVLIHTIISNDSIQHAGAIQTEVKKQMKRLAYVDTSVYSMYHNQVKAY